MELSRCKSSVPLTLHCAFTADCGKFMRGRSVSLNYQRICYTILCGYGAEFFEVLNFPHEAREHDYKGAIPFGMVCRSAHRQEIGGLFGQTRDMAVQLAEKHNRSAIYIWHTTIKPTEIVLEPHRKNTFRKENS